MSSKQSENGDEKNTSFELPEAVLEDLKPGLVYSEEESGDAAEGHHRFPRSEKKDIPQESIAERLRKALKGG